MISPVLKTIPAIMRILQHLRVHDGLHDHWLLCEIQYFYMTKERNYKAAKYVKYIFIQFHDDYSTLQS